ncbi:uncharacterized protein EV420DRAFT_1486481 [Desarmillaria tabescens]|uniref:Uncharacterized protein n=1 Tax=Armillaria tabescens TaxID=1929756 RepID=A0AA39JEA6_ARMTA|nr:uncharacterized protein EV420DRAFT_1486481 [Desarmillaria tabescens]KAK0439018.1 hypothetical protein EV420DRAFT_1486481 [Desarmillaria tabescens]
MRWINSPSQEATTFRPNTPKIHNLRLDTGKIPMDPGMIPVSPSSLTFNSSTPTSTTDSSVYELWRKMMETPLIKQNGEEPPSKKSTTLSSLPGESIKKVDIPQPVETDAGGHRRDESLELIGNAGPMLHASELGGGIYSPTEISRKAWGVHTGLGTSSQELSLKGDVSCWSPDTDSSYEAEVIQLKSEVTSRRSARLCNWLAHGIHQLARKERGVAEEKGILDWGAIFPVDYWITPEEGSWDLPTMPSDSNADDTWHFIAGDSWESPWPETSYEAFPWENEQYEAIWPNPMARTHIDENLWDSLSTPLFVGEEYQTVPEAEEGGNTLTDTSSDDDGTIHIFGAEFQH